MFLTKSFLFLLYFSHCPRSHLKGYQLIGGEDILFYTVHFLCSYGSYGHDRDVSAGRLAVKCVITYIKLKSWLIIRPQLTVWDLSEALTSLQWINIMCWRWKKKHLWLLPLSLPNCGYRLFIFTTTRYEWAELVSMCTHTPKMYTYTWTGMISVDLLMHT